MDRERKTVELCGCPGPNARCVKSLGHDGDHEFLPVTREIPTDRIRPLRR